MTVDEILTKFSFKADTAKAEKFAKTTDKMKESIKKTDDAWTRVNAKLAQGFQSKWFDQFSQKVTDLRRVQLFLGGIRRGFEMVSNVVPGLGKVSDAVTGITKNYNKFTTELINARSAIRSFGVLLGKTADGFMPAVRAEMEKMTSSIRKGFVKFKSMIAGLDFGAIGASIKAGLTRALNAMGEGLGKLVISARKGFANLHKFLLESNNVFLNKIGSSITNIQNTIGRFKGLHKLGQNIQALTANVPGLGKLTASFSALGLGATAALAGIVAGVVAAIAAIGKLINKVKVSTQQFISFESGMKGVQRVTLASADDMGRLEEAAKKAGEGSVFGLKEAADAQRFLAMAGLDVDQVIGALPGTLQLAAAAETDLATAADLTTNIMSSNQLQVEDLSRVNDILAFSASNSNQSVVELGTAIQNIGPAGRLANVSVEQMSAWLSVLANNGLRGAEAGTMVRNAIKDLVVPTDKMSAALEKGGIELSNFVDGAGKISDLNKFLMALQEMDEVSRAGFLATLDERTYKALAPIITGNAEAVAKFNQELKGAEGTAAEMAALAFQGLDGAIKEYKSKMETANVAFMQDSGLNLMFEEMVRIGSSILPEIWKLLGLAIKPFIKGLTAALKVVRVLTTFFGGILKILNSVFRSVLSILDIGLEPILSAVDQFSTGVQKVFDIFTNMERGPLKNIEFLMGLLGKGFAAISKVILGLVGPILFMVDVLLNLFLIILPNAFRDFIDFVTDAYENSIFGKLGDKLEEFARFLGGQGTPQEENAEDLWGFVAATAPPSPGVVNNNRGRSLSVGRMETNVSVTGGTTNEATGEVVAEAVREEISSQLRELAFEGE